jgi:UDP-glucuronate 4-epimerase
MAIHRFTALIAAGESIPIYGDGSARRDFTYIEDIVDGTLRALDRGRGCRVFNLGESRANTVSETVALIAAALGKTARIDYRPAEPGDVPATCADVSRARAELGYDPQVPLSEGIRRFVDWFRSAGERVP